MTTELAAAAEALRSLHQPGKPVVLANVWDAASAKLVEAAGFPAIATSSAAVADVLGYRDQEAPGDEMLAAAGRIARAVSVPVTVDAEAGYGLSADELVRQLLAAGTVGCNLEDTDYAAGGKTMVDVGRQAEWLAEVRTAAQRAGVPMVLNARIDVVIRAGLPADEQPLVEPIIERAKAYLAAGVDCVYPIVLRTPEAIRQVVDAVAPAAVNVTCAPDKALIEAAAELGVARVSMGGGLWRVVRTGLAQRLAVLAAD